MIPSPASPPGGGSALDRLDATLAALRDDVAAAVARDGADAQQLAVDRLVWCHAYTEAAHAMHAWAEQAAHPLVTRLAEAAALDASTYVHGADSDGTLRLGRLLAEIAGALAPALVPLEDLGASDDHRLLRSTLRAFAEREIEPLAQAIHRHDLDVPEPIVAGLAEIGLFGMSVPTEYGGSREAEDARAMLIATEELSRASLGAGGSLMTRPEILVRALLRGGTDEQRRRWLPRIASGEQLVAVGVSEPEYGSDVAALQCRADRQPDGTWEVNGAKLWCTFAGRSELLTVLCRTGEPGHRGLSMFVLEKPAFPGHTFEHRQPRGGTLQGRAIPMIGYRGMHTFELLFDRYRAPAAALVGGEAWLNRGFYLQMEGFSMGRIQTAGRAVGVMQAAFGSALAYAARRVAFGRPIFDNPLIRAKLGRMALQTHASRQLSYRAARLLDAGQGQTEASLAKLYASRMAELVTREAMQVYGGMGYSEETNVARYFVDGRVLAIFEGAEEVLSLRVIGRALLGGRP